jgi:hypothetical protein
VVVPVARFGALEVRAQLAPPAAYSALPSYHRYPPQPGIDDGHRPSVSRASDDHFVRPAALTLAPSPCKG